MEFQIQLVLADSLYSESKINFVNVLDELKLPYILAIRSNQGMWLPQGQRVYSKPWQCFQRFCCKDERVRGFNFL
jgi:SRSO17 transposase